MVINKEFAVNMVKAGSYLVYRKGVIIGKILKDESNLWNGYLFLPIETSVNTVTKRESVEWLIEKYREEISKKIV